MRHTPEEKYADPVDSAQSIRFEKVLRIYDRDQRKHIGKERRNEPLQGQIFVGGGVIDANPWPKERLKICIHAQYGVSQLSQQTSARSKRPCSNHQPLLGHLLRRFLVAR